MEQQNRQTPPQGYPESPGKSLWRIISPLVVQFGISMIMSMIIGAVFGVMYLMNHYGITEDILHNPVQLQSISEQILKDSMAVTQDMQKQLYRYGAFTQGLTALATIPFLAVMFHRDRIREKIKGFALNKKAALWKYPAVLILGGSLCVGLNNLMLIGNISTIGEEYVEMMEALYSAPFIVQVVSLAILVPVCEELVFRGLIFKRIRETSSFHRAAFHSALIFGLMHMNLVQTLYGFAMGMVFAYVYEKYGSIKAPVAAHMTANFISVAGTQLQWFRWMEEAPMRMGVVTVIAATVAATMYVLIQRIEEAPDLPETVDEESLAE